MDGCKHFEINVFGRVQGVGFRYAARNQARALGLKGWVKNLSDGSVRSAVQGDLDSCQKYIHWCRSGTGYSWVERIEIVEKPATTFKYFSVLY